MNMTITGNTSPTPGSRQLGPAWRGWCVHHRERHLVRGHHRQLTGSGQTCQSADIELDQYDATTFKLRWYTGERQ
jgi:hypothetical protein